ncbi:hypothetical protein ONZ43_g7225 [Nemania bipapillata]|uniref:Uncharacterized protein n=1 Tax=Nemania bipapillata TaxID=110536 RepID=A0ACC2HSA5_9PEZI|nr:hypothetical protein ONZ43_g7225 [Nemania bipapillata]
MHQQSVDGTPAVNPMVFLYPKDKKTAALDLQYFFGPGLLVAPVTEEDATSVGVYLPDDTFYDWDGRISRYLCAAGVIFPVRAEAAMTTTELRTKPFEIIVAIGRDGKASGSLYVDDGISVTQKATTSIKFTYAKGVLAVSGSFGYTKDLRLSKVTFLGLSKSHGAKRAVESFNVAGQTVQANVNVENDVVTIDVDEDLTHAFTVKVNA